MREDTSRSFQQPDLSEIQGVVDSLCSTHPHLAVALIGSRAKGTPKKYSDWDLGVTAGGAGLDGLQYIRLKSEVADLAEHLPRSVDLVNLDRAPSWFLENLNYRPVFLGGDSAQWENFKQRLKPYE